MSDAYMTESELAFQKRFSSYEQELRKCIEERDDVLFAAVFEVVKGLLLPTAMIVATLGSNWLVETVFGIDGLVRHIINAAVGSVALLGMAFYIFGIERRVRSMMPDLPIWNTTKEEF